MRTAMILAASGLALAGCSVSDKGNETAATDTTTTVEREAVAAPTPSPAPVQQAAIQTQPGPKGTSVALNKVAVTGDILTVALTFTGSNQCCVHIPIENVAVIDDATSQRISVLKDNAGKWMASPVGSSEKSIDVMDYQGAAQVWFKFPAPPATSKTVSITIPEVAPFDAVPVTR